MSTFIQDVLANLREKHPNLSELCIILPSRRACSYFKKELAKSTTVTLLSPELLSIEEFIQDLAILKPVSGVELLFELYDVYRQISPQESKDGIEEVMNWGPSLLQDFQEIDRHLAKADAIFSYMESIKEMDHWSLSEEQTEITKDYLSFWKSIPKIYQALNNSLYNKGKAYQGMMYREAFENLENYIQSNRRNKHVFIGFNALTHAEELIIKELLSNDLAEIYWDIDSSFLKRDYHSAAYFIRSYKNDWKIFNSKPFNWVSDNYIQKKNIDVVGCSGNIEQCKYVGELLANMIQENPNLDNCAIVLGDESLLIPLLNSLPPSIPPFNITMGLPLHKSPLADLFYKLFHIHKSGAKTFYYQDVLSILSNPYIATLLNGIDQDEFQSLLKSIKKQNIVYLSQTRLAELSPALDNVFGILFSPWKDAEGCLLKCKELLEILKAAYKKEEASNRIAFEYLFRFNELFNQVQYYQTNFGHLKSIGALQKLFNTMIKSETLDFRGEPFQGLQIMGMLESRVLDFDRVIVCSVNEQILPDGKNYNSFIPFEVKKHHNLQTYFEKDAVFTYHFYRLLQRATGITLIYNSDSEGLNSGEPSRFIKQLEVEGIHGLNHKVVSAKVPSSMGKELVVEKNEDIISSLEKVFSEGISVSGLQKYVRDPISFYKHYILGLREADTVEESLEARSFGTIVHNALEDCYKPLVGSKLDKINLTEAKKYVDRWVSHHFSEFYPDQSDLKGKNLIYYEVARRTITNFIDWEIDQVSRGHTIFLHSLEQEVNANLDIRNIPFPVKFKGKLDRIDEFDGQMRIIDYKTGAVSQSDLNIVEYSSLLEDYKKTSKAFQVLLYSLMITENGTLKLPLEAGIISFRNQGDGFLKFTKKQRKNAKGGHTSVDEGILSSFKEQLNILVEEILDPGIPFIEKEV